MKWPPRILDILIISLQEKQNCPLNQQTRECAALILVNTEAINLAESKRKLRKNRTFADLKTRETSTSIEVNISPGYKGNISQEVREGKEK